MSNLPPVPIPFSELFTPAPAGVGTNPAITPAASTWFYTLLAIAAQVGLPTTSWQPGGPERTILALMSSAFAAEDGVASSMAQGGFLDYAATGSTTTVAPNGTSSVAYVTPDPTIPSQWPSAWNGAWQPGWLDALASSVYNVTRIQATSATNLEAVANTTASPIGPYAAGTYHIANSTTGATYANAASLTVSSGILAGGGGLVTSVTGAGPITATTGAAHGRSVGQTLYMVLPGLTLSSPFGIITGVSTNTITVNVTASGAYTSGGQVYATTVATFTADVAGPTGSSAPGAINQTVTSNNGVFCGNVVSFVGIGYESNVALAARCRLKLQSLSPNGPAGAYAYFALTASQILAAYTPPVTLDCGTITKVLVQATPLTGVVTTTIASANAASNVLGANVVEGVSNLAVTGAANNGSGLIRLTTGTQSLVTGDYATVSGVIGTIEANGTWQVTFVDATHIDLQGSTFTNAYVSGGMVEAGDVGQVDRVLQANAVPDDVQAVTQSATAVPITLAATVTVPSSQVGAYQIAATAAVNAWVPTIAIGGGAAGVVDLSVFEGILYSAGSVSGAPSYVSDISGAQINGAAANYTFPSAIGDAVLTTLTITVVGS